MRLAAGSEVVDVKAVLLRKLRNAQVLTSPELRRRTIGRWLFATGAGAARIVGAALGVLVGTVIVQQSLYACASDRLFRVCYTSRLGLFCWLSVANFVSIALFGDGAAAVVLRNTRLSPSLGVKPASRLSGSIVPNTQHITGWDIKENSFGVVLSPELPSLIRSSLRPAFDGFLARNHLKLRDLTGVLLNPGGRRVLETAQNVLGLSKCDLRHSWDVLRE